MARGGLGQGVTVGSATGCAHSRATEFHAPRAARARRTRGRGGLGPLRQGEHLGGGAGGRAPAPLAGQIVGPRDHRVPRRRSRGGGEAGHRNGCESGDADDGDDEAIGHVLSLAHAHLRPPRGRQARPILSARSARLEAPPAAARVHSAPIAAAAAARSASVAARASSRAEHPAPASANAAAKPIRPHVARGRGPPRRTGRRTARRRRAQAAATAAGALPARLVSSRRPSPVTHRSAPASRSASPTASSTRGAPGVSSAPSSAARPPAAPPAAPAPGSACRSMPVARRTAPARTRQAGVEALHGLRAGALLRAEHPRGAARARGRGCPRRRRPG